jgi:hypothetical protein
MNEGIIGQIDGGVKIKHGFTAQGAGRREKINKFTANGPAHGRRTQSSHRRVCRERRIIRAIFFNLLHAVYRGHPALGHVSFTDNLTSLTVIESYFSTNYSKGANQGDCRSILSSLLYHVVLTRQVVQNGRQCIDPGSPYGPAMQ